MKPVVVVVVVVVAFVVSACSNSNRADTVSGHAPAKGLQSTPYSPFTDQATSPGQPKLPTAGSVQLRANSERLVPLLLTLDDMPAAYSPADVGQPGRQDGEICDAATVSQAVGYNDAPSTAMAVFQGSQVGPVVLQAVLGLSPDAARAAMGDVKKVMSSCSSWVVTDPDGTKVTWRISPLSLPVVGDQTFAARMSTRDVPFFGLAQIDYVFFRRAGVLEMLVVTKLATQQEPDIEGLLHTADAKLQTFLVP